MNVWPVWRHYKSYVSRVSATSEILRVPLADDVPDQGVQQLHDTVLSIGFLPCVTQLAVANYWPTNELRDQE